MGESGAAGSEGVFRAVGGDRRGMFGSGGLRGGPVPTQDGVKGKSPEARGEKGRRWVIGERAGVDREVVGFSPRRARRRGGIGTLAHGWA